MTLYHILLLVFVTIFLLGYVLALWRAQRQARTIRKTLRDHPELFERLVAGERPEGYAEMTDDDEREAWIRQILRGDEDL